MVRITLTLTHSRRGAVVLIILLLAILLSGSFASGPAQVEAAPSARSLPAGGSRHYYVTADHHSSVTTLGACGNGYHVASLWEILDVSNLRYDYDHPAAYNRDDSGHGPPSYWFGWVRTGYQSSTSTVAGTGNCANWTSLSAGDRGTAVRLPALWVTDPADIGAWDVASVACNTLQAVWCVRDHYTVYLPTVMR